MKASSPLNIECFAFLWRLLQAPLSPLPFSFHHVLTGFDLFESALTGLVGMQQRLKNRH